MQKNTINHISQLIEAHVREMNDKLHFAIRDSKDHTSSKVMNCLGDYAQALRTKDDFDRWVEQTDDPFKYTA